MNLTVIQTRAPYIRDHHRTNVHLPFFCEKSAIKFTLIFQIPSFPIRVISTVREVLEWSGQVWGVLRCRASSTLRRYSFGLRLAFAKADSRPPCQYPSKGLHLKLVNASLCMVQPLGSHQERIGKKERCIER